MVAPPCAPILPLDEQEQAVARVAVDVVIKTEILDPQGKAILAALDRAGHVGIRSVRAGKHFDLEVDDSVTDEELEKLAESVLANPVIETWTVTRVPDGLAPSGDATGIGVGSGTDAGASR